MACRDTHIPREVLLEYIDDLKKVFTQANYNLFHHNCNHFSNELATFLTGSGIPVGCFVKSDLCSTMATKAQGILAPCIALPQRHMTGFGLWLYSLH